MAYSIEQIESIAPDLADPYRKAGFSVNKNGLEGVQAAVYLVLDRSYSMVNYYQRGDVQYFAERILGMAAHFEDDGKVPVAFFGSGLDGTDELILGRHQGQIAKAHERLGGSRTMTATNYAVAMDAVVQHYMATGKTVPAFVVFQTDGSPQNKELARQRICQYAELPVFWQFVGFGEDRPYAYDDDEGLGFLQRLDDLPVPQMRRIDNCDFFAVGRDPRAMRDMELYNRLMTEFPTWAAQARLQGILH